MIFNWDGFLQ
ncbi:hypothetical protein C358_05887 [Cryptococcus neoformans MW-RSA852]|nr:hypothetical protein C358_05887 [Cryptococcus neoformans var. grubii MW-RSA852]